MGTYIFFYATIGIILLIVVVVFESNQNSISEEDLIKQAEKAEQLEKDLKQMYFLISEVDRISKEKSIAIKNNDWDLFKKLAEEQELNNIKFNYLSNKN